MSSKGPREHKRKERTKDVPLTQIQLGERLASERYRQGHTLMSLAAKADLCPKLINNIELARNFKVSFHDIIKLSRALDLDLMNLAELVVPRE